MDIYIDVLVVVNIYITWIFLILTKCVTHAYIKPLNLGIASLLGGLSSLLMLIQSDKLVVKVIIFTLKLALYCLLILIAFKNNHAKKFLLYSAIFAGLNVLLAGAMGWLAQRSGAQKIYVSSGTVYLNISPIALILTTAGVYVSISLITRFFEYRSDKFRAYTVSFSYNNSVYNIEGLADTGNAAKDVFSGRPIIICNGIEFYSEDGDFIRAVPYKTVSGEGILYAVKPDYIVISDESGFAKRVDALIASANKEGERRAIFNPALLR